ncbi:unnamed protein product [Lactuca virosa]|uniref:Uncharacterized protein n=1 Tax=Lactuca virosa TaxID=75947 RepID=A0AAU9M6I3_9ASTR|nr:unnamed protein product [Lactuca virosa]
MFQIAILYTGSLDDRSNAVASLVSLARDNDWYGKLIIEEGGVNPLLKLVTEGKLEGQENAAPAIGLLGRDPESVEHMIHAGVCSVFVKILKEGPMKVQAVVTWAVSELVAHYPKCQDLFVQQNIVRLLVGLGVPAVGMAFSGYVTQPNGMGNLEMTWLPVLAGAVGALGAAGALGATYCSPYITMDGSHHARPSGQTWY